MCFGISRCRHWWQAFWFVECSFSTELHTIQEFVELDSWTCIEFVCLPFSETFPWSCVIHLPVIPWSWVSWGTCKSCWARMLYPGWAWVQITHNCWDYWPVYCCQNLKKVALTVDKSTEQVTSYSSLGQYIADKMFSFIRWSQCWLENSKLKKYLLLRGTQNQLLTIFRRWQSSQHWNLFKPKTK